MAANVAPPSYEAVISNVKSHIPSQPKTDDVVNAVSKLSNRELETLAASFDRVINDSAEDLKKLDGVFAEKFAKSQAEMKELGSQNASACAKINEQFVQLHAQLVKIDTRNPPPIEGPWGPRLQTYHSALRSLMDDSTALSLKLANHLDRYSVTILPAVKDTTLPTARKIEKLEEFRNDGEAIGRESKSMSDKVAADQSKLKSFVKSFSAWAEDSIVAGDAKVAKLENDLRDMQSAYSKWTKGLIGSTIIFGMAFAAWALVMCLAFSGAGILIAGVTMSLWIPALIGVVVCVIGRRVQLDRIKAKKQEIDQLKTDIQDLKSACINMQNLETTSVASLDANIVFLGRICASVQADATSLAAYIDSLKAGVVNVTSQGETTTQKETHVSTSQVVPGDLVYSSGIYASMSKYLNGYADGIKTGIFSKTTIVSEI